MPSLFVLGLVKTLMQREYFDNLPISMFTTNLGKCTQTEGRHQTGSAAATYDFDLFAENVRCPKVQMAISSLQR